MIDPAMLALLLVQDKGAWEAYAAQSRTRRSPPPDEPHGERYGTERDGTEGRDCNGKSSSLRTDWQGLGQDHQEHVRWDFVGGQAAGQGLRLGAQKQRPTEGHVGWPKARPSKYSARANSRAPCQRGSAFRVGKIAINAAYVSSL